MPEQSGRRTRGKQKNWRGCISTERNNGRQSTGLAHIGGVVENELSDVGTRVDRLLDRLNGRRTRRLPLEETTVSTDDLSRSVTLS